jgi:hypothetical protein
MHVFSIMNHPGPAKTDAPSATTFPGSPPTTLSSSRDEKTRPLNIEISPAARRRLEAATRNSFWTPDLVVEQLLMDHLHEAYPVVTYRTVELAPPGTFRAFDRRSHRPALVFLTSTGRYQITVRTENADFQRLRQTYRERGSTQAENEATEMCLFKLQAYLEEGSADRKIIYPDDFLVQQMVERPLGAATPLAISSGGND